jgi:hypothetical protein
MPLLVIKAALGCGERTSKGEHVARRPNKTRPRLIRTTTSTAAISSPIIRTSTAFRISSTKRQKVMRCRRVVSALWPAGNSVHYVPRRTMSRPGVAPLAKAENGMRAGHSSRLSEAIEKREKLVAGSIASGLSVGRNDSIENPLLQPRSACKYIWVVSIDSWPSHSAITDRSIPCCNKSIDAACRSTWWLTRLVPNDGQVRVAAATCLANR